MDPELWLGLLGSARVAGIDLAIRTVERTAGVEIDYGYGIEP